MARAWHPVDLPKGVPNAVPAGSAARARPAVVSRAPRAVARSGCATVDGMPREPQRARSRAGRSNQKGTTPPGTRPHGMRRTSTATSKNGPAGYRSSTGVRIDTEERPRRAGRAPGWPGCGIPSTSPRGYHTPTRGQSYARSAGGCAEGCPRAGARSDCVRSTGCHTSAGAVWRSKLEANGPQAPVTPGDAPARTCRSGGTRRDRTSAPGRTHPRSGRRGRRFKSCHPDQLRRCPQSSRLDRLLL